MRSLLAPLLSLIASVGLAQGAPTAEAARAIVALPDQLTWGPAPPVLPAGAKLAGLEGDPTAAGAYTMRLLLPDRYRIPPHFHPFKGHVIVLKGAFKVGMGERFDASAMDRLPVGTFTLSSPMFGTTPSPKERPSSSSTGRPRGKRLTRGKGGTP